jgi:hypothetical protein
MASTPCPLIVRGHPYDAYIHVSGYPSGEPPFPTGGTFRAMVRPHAESAEVYADLSTGVGLGLTRVDDDTIRVQLTPDQTKLITHNVVVIDFIRTDVTPPTYTYVRADIPVLVPATRTT